MDPDNVHTFEDLSEFIWELRQNLIEKPDRWHNDTLESYLNGMAAWTGSMDGWMDNMKIPFDGEASWALFAKILLAARVYQ